MQYTRIDRVAATILIVEPDPLMLTALGSMMDMHGQRAVLARTQEVAKQAIGQRPIDVIVLSIEDLEGGCKFAEQLRENEATQDVPVIFLVPKQDATWTQQLRRHGGVYSLLKPYEPNALWELIEKVLWLPQLTQTRGQAPKANVATRQRDWLSLND